MIDIRPFRGLRYSVEKVGSLDTVTCPPYDVISDALWSELYRRSKYNVVRLVLGKTFEHDGEFDNRYTRAANFLRQWRAEGALKQDAVPALYAYEQQFVVGCRQYSRLGFIALVKLQELGKGDILPHEQTLSKPKEDRLMLLRSTHTNLSPVFSIFDDSEGVTDRVLREQIERLNPESAVDDTGTVNRMWTITDPAAISTIRQQLRGAQALIADGHHRYETSLDYRREVRQRLGDEAQGQELPCDFTMMMFVNMHDPGLVVLPTHRVVHGLDGFDADTVVRTCARRFTVEQVDLSVLASASDMTPAPFLSSWSRSAGLPRGSTVFGLYLAGRLYLLRLEGGPSQVGSMLDESRSEAWRSLDVSVLHSVILRHILGISEADQLAQSHIKYTRSLREAVSMVDSGACQAAFLMNPPSVQDVVRVARSGEKMPQKSTYFYPKLLTGLVLRPLD